MSQTLVCKTKMTDAQLLKKVLEEKMKWNKIQTKIDPKKPLPTAHMYGNEPDIESPDLLIKVSDIPGGRWADIAAKFNEEGTLTIHSDPHGMQGVRGYEKWVGGNTQEEWAEGFKKFTKDVGIEYAKKEIEEISDNIGAYVTKDWSLEGTEHRMEITIDEDNVDRLLL